MNVMPERIQPVGIIIESMFLTFVNALILVAWFSVLSAVPIILSSIWSIGRIKRDIDKHHSGKLTDYIRFLIGRAKKN